MSVNYYLSVGISGRLSVPFGFLTFSHDRIAGWAAYLAYRMMSNFQYLLMIGHHYHALGGHLDWTATGRGQGRGDGSYHPRGAVCGLGHLDQLCDYSRFPKGDRQILMLGHLHSSVHVIYVISTPLPSLSNLTCYHLRKTMGSWTIRPMVYNELHYFWSGA